MRAIIRFSVDGEQNSALRNKLAAALENGGFVLNPRVTATYENDDIEEHALGSVMLDFWHEANNPPNNARLDHVWMYADNPPNLPGH